METVLQEAMRSTNTMFECIGVRLSIIVDLLTMTWESIQQYFPIYEM